MQSFAPRLIPSKAIEAALHCNAFGKMLQGRLPPKFGQSSDKRLQSFLGEILHLCVVRAKHSAHRTQDRRCDGKQQFPRGFKADGVSVSERLSVGLQDRVNVSLGARGTKCNRPVEEVFSVQKEILN